MSKKVPVGEYIIQLLNDYGVEYFIGTPGTEFAPIIEKFDRDQESLKIKPILVPHEYLAVNMAYGIYLATGKPAAVMVHSTIGTLNAAAGIMNASRMNIPILFLAGKSSNNDHGFASRDLFIHWAQESFDQAGCIREYLKWDYELREIDEVGEMFSRGLSIALEEPKGPVYFSLPRNLLLNEIEQENDIIPINNNLMLSNSVEVIEELLRYIINSSRPVVVTKTIGEDLNSFQLFEDFINKYKIPVYCPNSHYLNISHDNDFYMGEDARYAIENADLIINFSMDVPWINSKSKPKEDCRVIHVGIDPNFIRIPKRNFKSTMQIKCLPKFILQDLVKSYQKNYSNEKKKWLEDLRSKRFFTTSNPDNQLTKQSIELVIDEIWNDDLILINELSLDPSHIKIKNFGSYFRTGSASGLGWAMGCALGLAISNSNKIILNVVGDGAYYFGNPLAYHWVIEKYKLPIITLVLNNEGMHSISNNVKAFFSSDGLALKKDLPFLDLRPSLLFDEVAKTFNGIGVKVVTRQELKRAIEFSFENCRSSSSQAIINAILK